RLMQNFELRGSCFGVESVASPGHRHQNLRGLESAGESIVQILEPLHQLRNSDRVHVSERPAAKWREAKTEHRTNIPIPRRSNHMLGETSRGFIQHRQNCALLNLRYGNLRASLHLISRCSSRFARTGSEQRVYALINFALLSFLVVEIKTFLRFSSVASRSTHCLHRRWRRESLAKRFVHDLPCFGAHVESHFIY